MQLWVVIPFYNEERLIESCLTALTRQSDMSFNMVLVNNASTDGSPRIVKDFLKAHPKLHAVLISEKQKGTGAAADTGFRYAIKHGATHIARTDADAMPQADWVAQIKNHFKAGARIIGGKLKPRKDEKNYRWWDGIIIPILIIISERAPRYLHRSPEHKYPMFMIAGLNMAIDAKLYIEAGGFPRTSIDTVDEDLELHLRVCRLIPRKQAHFARDVIIHGSIRKVKAFGYIGILLWYWDRKLKPKTVDVR